MKGSLTIALSVLCIALFGQNQILVKGKAYPCSDYDSHQFLFEFKDVVVLMHEKGATRTFESLDKTTLQGVGSLTAQAWERSYSSLYATEGSLVLLTREENKKEKAFDYYVESFDKLFKSTTARTKIASAAAKDKSAFAFKSPDSPNVIAGTGLRGYFLTGSVEKYEGQPLSFKVIDLNTLKETISVEYKFPFEGKPILTEDYNYLNDDFYISVRVFNDRGDNYKTILPWTYYTFIYRTKEKKWEQHAVESGNRVITQPFYTKDKDNNVTFWGTSTHSEEFFKKRLESNLYFKRFMDGFFVQKYDKANGKVLSSGHDSLGVEALLKFFSPFDKKKYLSKPGQRLIDLYDVRLIKAFFDDQNNHIVCAEVHGEQSFYSGNQSFPIDVFMDILILKISPDGKILWSESMKKFQTFGVDGEHLMNAAWSEHLISEEKAQTFFFFSYLVHLDKDKYTIFYNDSKKNMSFNPETDNEVDNFPGRGNHTLIMTLGPGQKLEKKAFWGADESDRFLVTNLGWLKSADNTYYAMSQKTKKFQEPIKLKF